MCNTIIEDQYICKYKFMHKILLGVVCFPLKSGIANYYLITEIWEWHVKENSIEPLANERNVVSLFTSFPWSSHV